MLDVLAVQPEGGRILTAKEAINGRIVRPGDRLENMEAASADARSDRDRLHRPE